MKIVHFADVHLGMTNFGWLDTETGLQTRVLDFLDSLDALVAHIERIKPDLALFAGDAFKTRTPSPTLLTHFISRMQSIANVCPLIMLVGNHDRQRGGDGKRHSIDIVDKIRATHDVRVMRNVRYDRLCLNMRDRVHIISIPWLYDVSILRVVKEMYDSYDNISHSYVDGDPVILLAHASVEGAQLNDSYTTSLDDEYTLPVDIFEDFDYSALGHIHKHQAVAKNAVYCGSLERVDWGERNDDKGFVLVTIEDGKTSWEFVSLNPRPMVNVRVRYKDIKSIGAISDDAIVRVTIDAALGASEPAINRAVRHQIDNAYLLDAINVVKPKTTRFRDVIEDRNSITPVELLDRWIDENIEGEEFGDKMWEAGLSLMQDVDEERML